MVYEAPMRHALVIALVTASLASAAGQKPVDVTGTWSPKYWTLRVAVKQTGDRVVGVNEGPMRDHFFRGQWSDGRLLLVANKLDLKRKKCEPRGVFVLSSKGTVTTLESSWFSGAKPQTGPWTRVTADGGPSVDYPWAEELSWCGMLRTYELTFASGSADLAGDDFPILEALAMLMKKDGTLKIDVAGHTDSTGDSARNTALSEERAKAVVKVLVEKYGVEAARLTASGHGEEQPLQDNKTDLGRAVNRRVELVLAH